ncbi:MAG: IS1595 family transposase [Segetibacter sp.]
MNLVEFQQKFSSEQECLNYLEKARWGDKAICPHCGSIKTYRFKSGVLFKCGDCRKQFTAKVGTIFSDSKVPLYKWFLAIYLATSLKKGISSVQLSKYAGVTQKTAWFMLQRIRFALEKGNGDLLSGNVEVDETYVGGKAQNRAYKKVAEKAVVFGMVERDGNSKLKHVRSSVARVLLPEISKSVVTASQIHSDQWGAYKTLPQRGYNHSVVNHVTQQYVTDLSHTQNIENIWSQLKRSIYGIYHHVSPKHLQKYCSETEYRYNTRKMTDIERFYAWFLRSNNRLKYKELINA